jgi:hypothetical protein
MAGLIALVAILAFCLACILLDPHGCVKKGVSNG